MDPTVRANQPPGYCGAIADELERVAADLRKAEHVELPEPRQFQLNIQPGGTTDEEVISGVDALGTALLGKKGEPDTVNCAPWYVADGRRGQVSVSIYRGLSKPPDGRDEEIEKLRARVAELEAGK